MVGQVHGLVLVTSFLTVWKVLSVPPAGYFTSIVIVLPGSQFPFVAEKKGLRLLGWDWFYTFGFLHRMNGSGNFCASQKAPFPAAAGSFGRFWKVVLFVL